MTIYIGNFDTQWKDENLRALFEPFGQVESAIVMMDVFTDKSRGFGYVTMTEESEGQAAIEALNQKPQGDRVLTVKVSEPQQERKGSYKVGNNSVNPYRFIKN